MGQAERPTYKRRQFLVNRPLQLSFVRAMLLILLLMASAALVAMRMAVHVTLFTYELSNDALLRALFDTVFWIIVLEMVFLAPFVIWMGILLTHKVAGPLVRIHAALAQMTEGRFDIHISLRKGDALVEFADAINRLALSLRNRLR